jgi:hypothetical protein
VWLSQITGRIAARTPEFYQPLQKFGIQLKQFEPLQKWRYVANEKLSISSLLMSATAF